MSAVKHAYVSKRFQEGSPNHMPFPFDKYKMPAAAKKWLTKYPVGSDDRFEDEFVYLDEIEERVSDHFKTQRFSDKYREMQNQNAVIGDYDDVDKVYPTMGSDTSYGRGNKINPSHYVNPQYMPSYRIHVANDKITPRAQMRNKGDLGAVMAVPPESPSLFKFWNFWHMFGATFIITVGKEWLILSSSDTHHYFMWYLVWGWIAGFAGEWFLWWKALRGQEYYDQRFFPLQENVDNLFTLLDRLEKKPDMGIVLGSYNAYIDTLRERLVTKRVTETVADKAAEVNEVLEAKFRQEQAGLDKPSKQWVTDALAETMTFFDNKAEQEKYMKAALAALKKDGGAKFGAAMNKSNVVQAKYDASRKVAEDKWFKDQRAAGSLPWTHATDAEKKKGSMSDADKKKLYDSIIADLSGKYHRFA